MALVNFRYKKYVMLDPLGVVTKTRTALENEEAALADAPTTIKTSEELQRLQAENYFYIPVIEEVPEIAVPDCLPNLLGKLLLLNIFFFRVIMLLNIIFYIVLQKKMSV